VSFSFRLVPKAVIITVKIQEEQQQLVTQVLSRKLQPYHTRLTSTADSAKRTAALASLRNDAGLQGLLPYLIR